MKVVKGCPLISKDRGLRLLQECKERKESGGLPCLQALRGPTVQLLDVNDLRVWLAQAVAKGALTREEQVLWLKSMFPEPLYDYSFARLFAAARTLVTSRPGVCLSDGPP